MLNKAGRPVGARIREAMEILDRIGPARAMEVCAHMEGVEMSNAGKYCSRAVALRLATVDRTIRWPVYAVVPGWRELVVAEPAERRAAPEPEPMARSGFALQATWSVHP